MAPTSVLDQDPGQETFSTIKQEEENTDEERRPSLEESFEGAQRVYQLIGENRFMDILDVTGKW